MCVAAICEEAVAKWPKRQYLMMMMMVMMMMIYQSHCHQSEAKSSRESIVF